MSLSRRITGIATRADLTPWATAPVTIYLRDGSFDEAQTFPPGGISTITSDLGGWSFDEVWCNEDGITESSYFIVMPGNLTAEFTLPYEDGTDISIEELMARGVVSWDPPGPDVTLDARWAQLASLLNEAQGANMVGWLADGSGADGQTARDKMRQIITTRDYLTVAAAVTAAAGKTLVVNSSVSVLASMTVTVALKVEYGGLLTIAAGQTLTINGPLEAGHYQIFAGAGTVAGTPKIEAAFPAWFGAAGVDMAVDTPALQKAAALYPVVRGDGQTGYIVDGQYQLWTLLDLHRAGRYRLGGWLGQSNFSDGYTVGVLVSRATIFEDMTIVLSMQGNATEKSHAFGFGDPTSATRMESAGFRRCTFMLADDLPDEPIRPHCALFQSVDNPVVEQCHFNGVITLKDLESIHVGTGLPKFRQITRLAGFSFYDCRDPQLTSNDWYACQLAAIFEFCDRPAFTLNKMRMCATALDFDKRDRDGVVIGNTAENDEDDTITLTQYIERMSKGDTDAWVEANGIDGLTLSGNRLRHVQRHLITNNKPNVALAWSAALDQSQDTDDFEYSVSRHVSHDDDVQGSWLSGFHMGASWEDETYIDPDTGEEIVLPSSHDGTICGDDYVIDSRYVDCGKGYNEGIYSSVVLIHEGTGIRFGKKFLIDGSASEGTGAYGVYARSSYTVDGAPIGATTYSNLRIESFGGMIRNTSLEAFFLDTPERVVFGGLVVRNAGTGQGGGGRQGNIYFPERRTAMISGELLIDPDGAVIDKGLQVRSTTFKTGAWRIDTSRFRILGHDNDTYLDNSTLGSEAVSTACFIIRPPLPLPIWPPALGNTSASPHWLEVNGGVIIRWAFAHATQGYAQVQFRVPENIVPDTLTVRCRIRSSIAETTEMRTKRRNHRAGQDLGWDAEDVLYDTADLTANWSDMTVATLTNMQAGEVVVLAFRPRAVGDAALTQNKSLLSVWIV